MLKKRKQYNNEFKFRVALEACKGQKTLNELATAHEIHPNQISQWKRQFLEEGPTVFGQDKERQVKAQAAEQSELYEQIGRLQMELAWLKKKVA